MQPGLILMEAHARHHYYHACMFQYVQLKAACQTAVMNINRSGCLWRFNSYNLLSVLVMVCAHMADLMTNCQNAFTAALF